MPITDAGLVVTPASTRIAEVRALLDANVGYPLDYDGTLEGAWTETAGTFIFDVETGQAIVLDATDPNRATGANLDRLLNPIIRRRPATYTRQTFRANASSTITYPAGYTVQFLDADNVARTFVTIEDTEVTTDTPVVFEAQDSGPIVVDSDQTGTNVRPFPGLTSVTWAAADGDPISLGRLRESDAEYRVRARQTRSAAAGSTEPGIRAAIGAISWVRAVSLGRPGPARIEVTVVPAPVGGDRELELAETISGVIAFGVVTEGDDSLTIDLPDGSTTTIYWSVGTTANVAVVASVALATGVTLASVIDAIEAAILGEFAALNVGDILRWGRVFCAIMDVSGVVGIPTLTLNGGTSDITPLATQILVASPAPVIT